MTFTLPQGYQIREMNEQEFTSLMQKSSKEVFGESYLTFRLPDTFTEEERQKNIQLKANMGTPYTLRLGVLHESDGFVGWHFGYQESPLKFYMCNSGVLPNHRCKGVYTALVRKVIDTVTALGFQTIYSRHHPTNNAVIIPKLKMGFLITSFEIDDIHGTLVHLSYFPKSVRIKIMGYRSGHSHPDSEVRTVLGLKS